MTTDLIPGMQIVRLPIADLIPNPKNYRQHTEQQTLYLIESLKVHGQQRPVVITADHIILAGHGLVQAAKRVGWDSIDCIVYSGPHPEAFLLMDNQSSTYAYDDTDALIALLRDLREQEVPLEAAGFDTEEVVNLLRDIDAPPTPAEAKPLRDHIAAVTEEDDDPDGMARPVDLSSHDVPDALWPTDNEWDIPVLDLHYQADALDMPVNKWGIGRKAIGSGTLHFYTEDAKFEYLWKNPQGLVNYGCVTAVEPNFSTNYQMPKALVLYHVYRKRWMARYWQSKGIRMFVDLNVAQEWQELNLIGVPVGWRAYATRAYATRIETLYPIYEQGVARAGTDDIMFVVIGGRESVKEECKKYGWIHVPEHQQLVHGKVTSGALAQKTKDWDSKANKRKKVGA